MDAYRKENYIVLWIKTAERDFRVTRAFEHYIYLDLEGRDFLEKNNVPYRLVGRKTYMGRLRDVLEVKVPRLSEFERFVKWIEKGTRYRLAMFNADIKPEQMFLYKNWLVPCGAVELGGNKIRPIENSPIPLRKATIRVLPSKDIYTNPNCEIKGIILDDKKIEGNEREILLKFKERFYFSNPDVVQMGFAFSRAPYLMGRFILNKIKFSFHRWDSIPLYYKGGKTFHSYGAVRYRDYAIRLRGRFLVDTSTHVGSECEPDAIVELCQLSGSCFQQTASRSFGAVFQNALVREMVRQKIIVPFKEKPIERPYTLFELFKTDRAGYTADPKTGFHKDVAEVDFCSMYPWLIYNHNISADTILADKGPFEHVPGVPVRVSLRHRGLTPTALKPFIDRRMHYKRNPTAVNKIRAAGLKWVLVSSFGYLRFREFKLGIASAHTAICAYSREILVRAQNLAESKGFEVVHGIIDSLYIKKKGIKEEEVKEFCRELELITGIPISLEGIFKWVVFLPSINDSERPVPTRYFGVFNHGGIKARGIEVRQRSVPFVVKYFQEECLKALSSCETKREIISKVPVLYNLLRAVVKKIPSMDVSYLVSSIRITKTHYKNNIPQRIIINALREKGVNVQGGKAINFIYSQRGVVLPEDYDGRVDTDYYRKLLLRSLYALIQPFGITRKDLLQGYEKQTKLTDFVSVKHLYIPMLNQPSEKGGLSEKILRRRLEKQGWIVWRGGLIGIEKTTEYPNVLRKYMQLTDLLRKRGVYDDLEYLSRIHHGMPDFLCYRNGEFKFVECKLQYESLSENQRRCIPKLQSLGFRVEVHKLVDKRTKLREANVGFDGRKKLVEKQSML
jgi:DNA polymerase elongation subunit (family B)